MAETNEDAGVISRILSQFPCKPSFTDEQMLEHVRSALSRGLPEMAPALPHDRLMSIAGGGPSLEDTWRELDGVIVTANGGFGFLMERGIKPWAVGLFDARPHIADMVEPDPDIFFFVASTCHPSVFEKLKGSQIVLWHPLGMPGIEEMEGAQHFIGGGTTMGLRWLTMGYFMGFRRFNCHGLDSSFRGARTHAYADYRDGLRGLEMYGYRTAVNFIQQVGDWFQTKAMFERLPEDERPEIRLFGNGLLQHCDQHNLR